MRREPTEEEFEKITEAIFGGDRVEATNIYLTITQCGLTEAQTFVRTRTAELTQSNPQKFVRKPQGKRNWFRL